MTLSEVLSTARQFSAIDKLKPIRILAENLEMTENIAPLEPLKTYELPTPYDCYGAGAILIESLKQADKS